MIGMPNQRALESLSPSASVTDHQGRVGWPVMLLLVAAALVPLVLHLDQRGDTQSDEKFYMVAALTMVESGQWLVPTYNDLPRLQKFPLQYWLVAGSYKLFGVGAWQARLPSVAAGAGTLILTYWLGVLLFDSRRAGLYGACALLSSTAFMQHAHWAVTDAPLALFTVATFCGFAATLVRGRRWGGLLAWVAMACAVMQKTPLSVIMPLGAVVLWMMLAGRGRGVKWRSVFSPVGIALFLALVLPWPIALLANLGREGVLRDVGIEVGRHIVLMPGHFARGVFYYAAVLVQGIFPWSLLYFFYRRRTAWTAPAAMLWLWSGFATLSFALVITMLRVRYLVPELPALALISGYALERVQAQREAEHWAWRLITWGVDGMLVGLALAGMCLLPSAFALIHTPAAFLTPGCMTIMSVAALVLVRRFRCAKPEGAGWVITAALGIELAQGLLLFSWYIAIPQDPAWQLARRYLRGVPVGQITGVKLDNQQMAWSWLAVGGSFRNESLPLQQPPSTRYLLVGGDDLGEISVDVRQRYTIIATARGQQNPKWNMFWFVGNRADKLEKWRKGFRTAVLLERQPSTP
jgi:4-amino-4-deoxy-L-arabinose transferase-like glycosyltransferase